MCKGNINVRVIFLTIVLVHEYHELQYRRVVNFIPITYVCIILDIDGSKYRGVRVGVDYRGCNPPLSLIFLN